MMEYLKSFLSLLRRALWDIIGLEEIEKYKNYSNLKLYSKKLGRGLIGGSCCHWYKN